MCYIPSIPFFQSDPCSINCFPRFSWISTLPDTFAQAGLHSVTHSIHAPTPASLPYQLDVFLLTYEELSYKTLDGLLGGKGEYLRELIEKASEQGRKGVAWGMDKWVVVGRKPVEGDVSAESKDGRGEEGEIRGKVASRQVSDEREAGGEKRRSWRHRFLRFWRPETRNSGSA